MRGGSSPTAGVPRRIARELKVHGQSIVAGRVARRVAARTGRPLLVGPWGSEVGFELLYWIPMLRHLLRDSDPGRRVIAVSRGGVAGWYSGVAAEYVDLLDVFAPEELRHDHEQRAARRLGQKQAHISAFDRTAIARVTGHLGLTPRDVEVLHPWVMYRRFRAVWMRRRPPTVALAELDITPFERPARTPGPPYVALKAYHSEVFPPTEANVARLRGLVERVALHIPVRLLRSGIQLDDHRDVELEALPGVTAVAADDARGNLASQAAVVAGAQALIATYGGFGYLGPLLGVPTVTFHSTDTFNTVHLDVLRGTLRTLRGQAADPSRFAFLALDLHHPALDLFAVNQSTRW